MASSSNVAEEYAKLLDTNDDLQDAYSECEMYGGLPSLVLNNEQGGSQDAADDKLATSTMGEFDVAGLQTGLDNEKFLHLSSHRTSNKLS